MNLKANFSVDVVRRDDQLVLAFDFHNLALEAATATQPARLVRDAAGDMIVVVHFPRQSLGEQSFFELDGKIITHPPDEALGTENPIALPIGARMSGDVQASKANEEGSPCARWLVFRVPDVLLPISYTLPELLRALSQCDQIVRTELSPPVFPPRLKGKSVGAGLSDRVFSAIEAPYRLVLSPNAGTRWAHAAAPKTNSAGTRTELWHTRLGVKGSGNSVDEKNAANRTARAVWSQDYKPTDNRDHHNDPFRMPLDRRDRYELVRLTSDTGIPNFTPTPVAVDQFMLSALGAWLKVFGTWKVPVDLPNSDGDKLTIEEWRHLMTLGRDHLVRVVYTGHLCDLGHRASLVKVSERKFQHTAGAAADDQSGYLRTRMFVVVREPVKLYDRRDLPFTRVEVKTRITPAIADPILNQAYTGAGQDAFWIRTADGDFPFQVAATDRVNQIAEWTMPQMFVSPKADVAKVIKAYNSAKEALRRRTLGGQRIAYAAPAQSGDTTLETSELVFSAAPAPDDPGFAPAISSAEVDLPAVKQLLGISTPSTVAWEPSYLAATGTHFGNKSDVFLQVANKPPLTLDVQKAGGLGTPNIQITALSRAFGPVDAAEKTRINETTKLAESLGSMLDGNFAPEGLFPDDLTILGGIKLKDLFAWRSFASAEIASDRVPNLKTVRKDDTIETSYVWTLGPDGLRSWPLFSADPVTGGFAIKSVLTKKLDGSAPTFSATGHINNFAIMLLPGAELVSLDFNSVVFTAVTGRKMDVAVNFKGLRFHGALEFVDQLSKVIPLDGFNDPPYLDVIPPPDPHAGVNVGFTLGIPDIGVGAFTLQNIALGAGFYLPFVGEPMNLHFAFCEREQPFILTVYGLGGGGFFGLDIGIAGVTMVEASLEFGASVALNLGVAAGSATIMGGFYYQQAGGGFQIACFIRASGELEVLGFISVSCEFYIALVYVSKQTPAVDHNGKLFGQAKLTVKIKIAFFSKSVSISMEREIAGSDPKFIDQMLPPEWALYCDSFADYPVV